jgi:hypothetical protein
VRDGVGRGARSVEPAAGDPDARRARELLVQVLAVAAEPSSGASARPLAQLSEVAEAALAVRPADRAWQETSSAVIRLRDLVAASGDAARIRDAVRDVVRRLT